MNQSALYEAVCIEFPPVWPEEHEWENVHDGLEPNTKAISNLLSCHIGAPEVVVVVHHLQIAAKMYARGEPILRMTGVDGQHASAGFALP